MSDSFKTSTKRHSSGVTDSLSQKQRTESDSILILHSLDKIAVLLKKQEQETNLPLVLNFMNKITVFLRKGG